MIELQKISKYYESKYQRSFILREINLTVKEGEFLTIMGPSGAGKSTLLHIIGLLESATEGKYLFDGNEVQDLKEKQRTVYHREHLGIVFQAYHLIDELTVFENIETSLLYKGVKNKERKAMVADMLDRFNMVAKKDLFPSQLSGGQQQVVGICRAIIGKPRLLLADEPTGNLHSKQGEQIMEIFNELHDEGMTIIQVTHSEKNALYGDRTIYIEDGCIRGEVTKESGAWTELGLAETFK